MTFSRTVPAKIYGGGRSARPRRVVSLALDGACRHTLDDVLLAENVDDDDGQDGQDDAGHHGTHLHAAKAAAEVLDQNGDGHVFCAVQHQIRQQVVVPHPHGFQYADADKCRLQHGHYHQKEGAERAAAVDHGGLLDLQRDGFHEAGEHEHRQSCAEAKIDNADVEGGVQLRFIRQICQGEHEHLEGHHHGEHEQEVAELRGPRLHAGDKPRAHGAANQDQHHRGDGDNKAVEEGGKKALGMDCVGIITQPGKALGGRQLKSGVGGNGGVLFEGVDEHHHHGVDPRKTEDRQDHRPEGVDGLRAFFHHCCTSLERVNFSCRLEMAMTRMQNSTAFACPIPFHMGPERA